MKEEGRYCSNLMKKYFNKELLHQKTMKILKILLSTNCWICDNDYINTDFKVRVHRHITGKYKGFAHKDCNINVKLNHKFLVILHNLKNYDLHLIMHKLCKFNLKINVGF